METATKSAKNPWEDRPFQEPPVGKMEDGEARSLSVSDGKISVHPPQKATARRLGSLRHSRFGNLRYAFGDSGSGVQCANASGDFFPVEGRGKSALGAFSTNRAALRLRGWSHTGTNHFAAMLNPQ